MDLDKTNLSGGSLISSKVDLFNNKSFEKDDLSVKITKRSSYKDITCFMHTKIKNQIGLELFSFMFKSSKFLASKGIMNIYGLVYLNKKDLDSIENYIKELILKIWKDGEVVFHKESYSKYNKPKDAPIDSINIKRSRSKSHLHMIAEKADNLESFEKIENFLISALKTNSNSLKTFENNVLFIEGYSGSGKTHILNECSIIAQKNLIKTEYYSADLFTSEYISAIKSNNLFHFRQKVRSQDLLMIDAFDTLVKRKSTFNELLEHIKYFNDSGKKVILTSTNGKVDVAKFIKNDLRTQISCATSINLLKPSFESKMKMISGIFQSKNIQIGKSLLKSITSVLDGCGFRDCISFSILLIDSFENKVKDLSIVNIKDIYDTHFSYGNSSEFNLQDRINPDIIIKSVCKYFSLDSSKFSEKTGCKNHILGRRILIYLLRNLGKYKNINIAKYLNISPVICIQDYNKAISLIEKKISIKYDVVAIKQMIVQITKGL